MMEKLERQKELAVGMQTNLEKCQAEVNEFMHLMSRYKSIPLKEDGREVYLINSDWMDNWRKYTWFYSISRGQKPPPLDPEHFDNYYPTRINNETLLLNKDAHYSIPDEGKGNYYLSSFLLI